LKLSSPGFPGFFCPVEEGRFAVLTDSFDDRRDPAQKEEIR